MPQKAEQGHTFSNVREPLLLIIAYCGTDMLVIAIVTAVQLILLCTGSAPPTALKIERILGKAGGGEAIEWHFRFWSLADQVGISSLSLTGFVTLM